jgi:hypothetical protein
MAVLPPQPKAPLLAGDELSPEWLQYFHSLADISFGWRHASDFTKIDGGDIYANSIVVGGLQSGVTDLMFDSATASDNIQAWPHASDVTKIDGGDVYVGSEILVGTTTTGGKISIGDATFGNKGIQIHWDGATQKPKLYAGDGVNDYVQYDGDNVIISLSKAGEALTVKSGADIVLEDGGDLILEAGASDSAEIEFKTTGGTSLAKLGCEGNNTRITWESSSDQSYQLYIGTNRAGGDARFNTVHVQAYNTAHYQANYSGTRYSQILCDADATDASGSWVTLYDADTFVRLDMDADASPTADLKAQYDADDYARLYLYGWTASYAQLEVSDGSFVSYARQTGEYLELQHAHTLSGGVDSGQVRIWTYGGTMATNETMNLPAGHGYFMCTGLFSDGDKIQGIGYIENDRTVGITHSNANFGGSGNGNLELYDTGSVVVLKNERDVDTVTELSFWWFMTT